MKAKVLRNGFLAATAFLYTVVSVSVNAQSIEPSGIAFFQGSWEDALARAESEKKMVFVDVYTEWCGPCKSMDQHVFPQAVVGEVYNSHFVSIKLDAEKGKGWSWRSAMVYKPIPRFCTWTRRAM